MVKKKVKKKTRLRWKRGERGRDEGGEDQGGREIKRSITREDDNRGCGVGGGGVQRYSAKEEGKLVRERHQKGKIK